MGSVYRRYVRVCEVCAARLDTTAARRACEAAGHAIRRQPQGPWWIRYRVDGRPHEVSTGTHDRELAARMLRAHDASPRGTEPALAPTAAAVPEVLTVDAAAEDLLADYRINQKRSLRTVTLRVRKHLLPFFGGRPLISVTTPLVREYITARQGESASNATINRDLIALKRIFSLAIQAGTVTTRPYVPLLRERNVRTGFFERPDLTRITAALPAHMRGVAEFAFVTGWRTPSEILPLAWRQVDFEAADVRLDPGTTKNGEGRVFPMTTDLRRILEQQRTIADAVARARGVTPEAVFCYTVGRRAGQPISAVAYIHEWWRARVRAGCPDRIPHDFRRTAVRNLVRAGVPERVAMQLTGHKTRAVFERYNITSPNDLRDAAARLDAYAAAGR